MYCRKSTDSEDQQVQSIEDQKRELNKIVAARNLNVVKVFDESKTAKQPGRPIYNEMMQLLKSGEVQGVLCWKLNRLARNPIDGGEIQWLLQQSVIQSIITPSREYLPTDNFLLMAVELGMATQYSLDLGKDVKRGLYAKAEKGWFPGKAPIGYMNERIAKKGTRRVFTDPEKHPLVRKMWEYLLSGNYTVAQVRDIANEKLGLRNSAGNKLGKSHVYKTFTNPFYYGEFNFGGESFEGKHEPMITPEEYDLTQSILKKAGKPRPKHKRLPFTGIVKCGECGGMITAEEKFKKIKSTGEIKRYLYHRCTRNKSHIPCNQKAINHEDFSTQIHDILGSITIPKEFLHWATKILEEQNKTEKTERNSVLKSQQKNYKDCLKRIDNLVQLYINPKNTENHLLTEEEFKSQKNYLTQEKGRIEKEIRNTEEGVNEWLDLTVEKFEFATYAQRHFDEGDIPTKSAILRAIGQNFVFMDGKLTIQLKEPFLTLKKGLAEDPLKKARLEPVKFGFANKKSRPLSEAFSVWYPLGESNPCFQDENLTS
jgi:site-specific DNA recombinase